MNIELIRDFDVEKGQKGHTKVEIELVQDFDVEKTTIKLHRKFMKLIYSYHIHKVLPDTASLKV